MNSWSPRHDPTIFRHLGQVWIVVFRSFMQKGTQQHGRQQLVKHSKIGKKQLARQAPPPPTAIVVNQVDGLRTLLISVQTMLPQYGHCNLVGSILGICLSLIMLSIFILKWFDRKNMKVTLFQNQNLSKLCNEDINEEPSQCCRGYNRANSNSNRCKSSSWHSWLSWSSFERISCNSDTLPLKVLRDPLSLWILNFFGSFDFHGFVFENWNVAFWQKKFQDQNDQNKV